MAYSPEQWDVVRAFFESGLSLSEIVERTEVKIKDRSTISKKAKSEGWMKGKIQPLISREVQNKQQLADIEVEKSTLNSTELKIAETLVDERTKHIQFFTHAAVTNVKQAMDEPCEGQAGYRMRAETILKGKETVLGKTPDTAIQINNTPADRSLSVSFVKPDAG
ncbi:MAG: hypothetical protein B7Y82_14385 [Sphingomonadales bacterium 32-65-25]|nr:MAG: hypothetical protein B7Y82_14385 [Sphingomonadales bacterium 32-65-25]